MNANNDITRKVQEAMNSLDGIQRAMPLPYFYTRLRARIDREEKGWSGIAGFISRPVYALAMVCVVLFVNVWILYSSNSHEIMNNTSTNNLQITSELPEEYNVAVSTFYDYETP